jgi:Leucine-rich repeat (LRR) protein
VIVFYAPPISIGLTKSTVKNNKLYRGGRNRFFSRRNEQMRALFLLAIVLTCFLSFSSQTALAQIPKAEREVLIALYISTDGENWRDNTGWLGAAGTECDWYGVTCDAEQRYVEILDLNINYLTGSIPAEIGNLRHLQRLSLDINQLTGRIPVEIGKLTQLQYLNLARNQLSGGIPAEIGKLKQLQVLHLVRNQFTDSIPIDIYKLTQLQHLYLNDNQLTGSILAEIDQLTKLKGLWVYNNELSGNIPAEIGYLTQLHHLSLPYNQLSGSIPVEIMNLPLVYLDLCGNSLYTDNADLLGFLDSVGGMLDWENCQAD